MCIRDRNGATQNQLKIMKKLVLPLVFFLLSGCYYDSEERRIYDYKLCNCDEQFSKCRISNNEQTLYIYQSKFFFRESYAPKTLFGIILCCERQYLQLDQEWSS
eukprot:TRINITY_DN6411_c0_g1_i3.p3 TRINITY_DN6411_c0_g1~~TRINITY_DN6411_c0_g1_i3.p3  ORF type:complete len:104 (-),score=2.93 TRINITY_DN6411_c0_g1_i3:694-1005(-)